ncbi:MAG TPA: ABC transporter permease [Anaeromyxobacter sp.]|nr:ABC transporter permease [Anaeromyxobacter sp.]
METRASRAILRNTTGILFVLVFLIFGMLARNFLTLTNLQVVLSNSSYIGIITVGMTFVLLVGGIDLSVGSIMYLSAVATSLVVNDLELSPWLGVVACLGVGLVFGAFNAFAVTKLGIVPFVATLVTMIAGRGLGLLVTQSVQLDFPDSITLLATVRLGGVQLNILIYALVVAAAALFLIRTPWGRRIYAVGNDPEAARKAGLKVQRIIASTYVISGVCAALGGFVSIAQIGRVPASFGRNSEFDAIAAAVLGGVSLFGGVGTVFPGALLGTVMIRVIQAGLVARNVDIYIQPIIMGAIIFFAVLLDALRNLQLKKLGRRNIMKLET